MPHPFELRYEELSRRLDDFDVRLKAIERSMSDEHNQSGRNGKETRRARKKSLGAGAEKGEDFGVSEDAIKAVLG